MVLKCILHCLLIVVNCFHCYETCIYFCFDIHCVTQIHVNVCTANGTGVQMSYC